MLLINTASGQIKSDDQVARLKIYHEMKKSMVDELLKPWYPASIDTIYGGFLSTFTYDFKPRGNQDKMVVTQARHTWSNAKAAEAGKKDLDGAMRILDTTLAGKSYLVDDKFSLADLAVSSYLGWLKFMGYDYSSFKNVQAWGDRCLGRPAAVKTNSPA